jgi:AcrR family transcriptional regulator
MRSISDVGVDIDRTAQARIRDAAIDRFPRDGFAGTTVRDIAADAGVSPALVIHHFGSKSGLREECDHYVIQTLGEMKRRTMQDGTSRRGGALAAMYQLMEPVTRYLAWALRTGGEASERIFDELLDDVVAQVAEYEASGLVTPLGDRRTQAVVMLVMQLGGLVLHEHYTRTLGVDTLSADGMLTIAPYMLRIYSGEFIDPRLLSDVETALSELDEEETQKEKP